MPLNALQGFGKNIEARDRKKQLIALDNPEFERNFAVFGDDQIQARYLLSTSFMETLLAFQRKTQRRIYVSFVGAKVFVAVPYKRRLFETDLFHPVVAFEPVQEYVDDLQCALSIVEDLKLNTDLWKVEEAQRLDPELVNILDKYHSHLNDLPVSFHPFIPETRLKNALGSYTSACSDTEIPLVLIDDSVSGSGKIGCLVTDQYFYVQDSQPFRSPQRFHLSELTAIRVRTLPPSEILSVKNQDIIWLTGISPSTAQQFVNMLQEMGRYHRQQTEHTHIEGKASYGSDVARFISRRLDQGLQAILDTHCHALRGKRIYVSAVDIPGEKLFNAGHSYLTDYSSEETPIILIDTTLFGTGKKGALITNTHLYARDPDTNTPVKTNIADLRDIQVKEGHILYANGTRLLSLGLPRETMLAIARLLEDMAAYYRT